MVGEKEDLMRLRVIALALAVGFGVAGIASAQPGNTPPNGGAPAGAHPPGAPAGPSPGPAQNRREAIKKRLRELRAYQLTEQVSLDDATVARLFPLLARYDDEIDRLIVARAEVQRRLNDTSTGGDPRAIDRAIDDAVANQRGFRDVEDRRIADLRKILTPAQTARVLIVLPAIERKIENQLRNAIENGGAGKRGAAGPGRKNNRRPVGGDDDDDQFDLTTQPANAIDPFDPRPVGKQVVKKPAPAHPCDPFDSAHGC